MILPSQINDVLTKATCLYTKDEVETAIQRMALSITGRLEDTNPVLLCVMIGAVVPLGQLLPHLNFPLEVDYIHATRYQGELTGGEMNFKVEPGCSLEGRTVLVVDDILDGGITLDVVMSYCREKKAKEVLSAVMVDKRTQRKENGIEKADFTALEVEDRYVFGYGLDYKEYLRNAPGIYAVSDEHI